MRTTILSNAVIAALFACQGLAAQAAEQADNIVVYGDAINDALPPTALPIESVRDLMTTGDALRDINGISGSRMGGHGVDPTIRGQSHSRLNILLDGAFVHGGCPNRMDPQSSYAPMASYDEINVIRGTQTLQYGSGGAGGTVLFERNTAPFNDGDPIRFKGGAGYKSNSDTKNIHADIASGNSNGYLRFQAGYDEAENYEDGDGREVRSSYRQKNGTLIAALTPDSNSVYEVSLEATRADDLLFAGSMMDSPYSYNDTLRLKFDKTNLSGLFSSLKGELSYSQVDHLMDNYSYRTSGMQRRTIADSDTLTGRLVGTIDTGNGSWKIGIDHQGNERDAEFQTSALAVVNYMWPGAEIKQTGVFAEYNFGVSERDRLTTGLRYDHVNAKATKADQAGSGGTANALYAANYNGATATDKTENNWGGLLRWERTLNSATTVYSTLSRTVRTADATERYVAKNASTDWVGNPNLAPEKHHQIEFGFINKQVNGFNFQSSVFYNDVDDFILQNKDGDGDTIYSNISAELYGGELAVNRNWGNWRSSFSLAYTHGDNKTENQALPQIAPLEATLSLDYDAGNWDLGGRIRAATEQDRVDLDVDAGTTAGWAVVDIYGSTQLSKSAKLRFGIDNLFDNTYAQHLNRASSFDATVDQVNEPGLSAWINVVIDTQ